MQKGEPIKPRVDLPERFLTNDKGRFFVGPKEEPFHQLCQVAKPQAILGLRVLEAPNAQDRLRAEKRLGPGDRPLATPEVGVLNALPAAHALVSGKTALVWGSSNVKATCATPPASTIARLLLIKLVR